MIQENYMTISQINNYLKLMFDENPYLKKIYLKGEISNFKHHTSGHLYLTLKDDDSRINAIMFKSAAQSLNFKPEDGMNVLVTGRISVYPSGGSYQIYIDKMETDGLGNLYVEYEKLKRKLQQEGLFDPRFKKSIPKYPSKIGIVTAPTGAAIKDILSTIKRRFPLCETILFPALVQGVSAAADVAKKIEMAQQYDIDVLIVGRGGGSIEDLWAFNEEVVARAIFASRIPVISAVGHEVDVTIADYVADMRAPTPTGAAEMAVPTVVEVKNIFHTKQIELSSKFHRMLDNASSTLKKLKDSYVLKNPMMLYDTKIQKLDTLTDDIKKSMSLYLTQKQTILDHLKTSFILQNPETLYEKKVRDFETLKTLLEKDKDAILERKNQDLQMMIQTLKLVNPLNILDKGYSLVKLGDKIIKDSKEIKKSDLLNIRLAKGALNVEVKEIIK